MLHLAVFSYLLDRDNESRRAKLAMILFHVCTDWGKYTLDPAK